MKRKDLIQEIEQIGCIFVRHGGKHDWYQNLARNIIKKLSD